MARHHSLSGPIIHQGTSSIFMYCISTKHACPIYPILYSDVPSLLGHEGLYVSSSTICLPLYLSVSIFLLRFFCFYSLIYHYSVSITIIILGRSKSIGSPPSSTSASEISIEDLEILILKKQHLQSGVSAFASPAKSSPPYQQDQKHQHLTALVKSPPQQQVQQHYHPVPIQPPKQVQAGSRSIRLSENMPRRCAIAQNSLKY
jgi:hypothetical protein